MALRSPICEVFGQAGYIRTTYTPYGSVTEEEDVTQPLQWSSEYADPELGLIYYNYRYYNPSDGRWLRRDPAGDESDAGLYDYVGNASLKWIDILGLKSSIQATIEQAVLRGDMRTLERLLEIELSAAERQLVRDALKELVKEKVKPREKSETDPGECSPKRHRQLQNEVNRTKDNKRGCKKAQSCEELKINLKSMNEHAKARRTINNECYRGGDAGHKKAFIETMKGIKTCEKLIAEKCWKCF